MRRAAVFENTKKETVFFFYEKDASRQFKGCRMSFENESRMGPGYVRKYFRHLNVFMRQVPFVVVIVAPRCKFIYIRAPVFLRATHTYVLSIICIEVLGKN